MVRGDTDKAETIRLAGLYLGPLFLALTMGAAIYGTACDGRRFALFSPPPPGLATLFLVVFIFIAWSVREQTTRVGFVLFAGLHGIALLAPTAGFVSDRWTFNVMFVLGAVLITSGGVRGATRRDFVLAGCGFLVVFALSYASRYYADALLERRSVVGSSRLC